MEKFINLSNTDFHIPIDPTDKGKILIWKDTYPFLNQLLRNNNVRVFVEIGVAGGQNLAYLSKNSSVLNLYGVDSYSPESFDMSHSMILDYFGSFDNLFLCVNDYLNKITFGKAIIYRLPSNLGYKKFKNKSVDMIFIDADHSFRSVLQDILLYLFKIKKSGLISGHDFNHPIFPGTTKAVNLVFGDVSEGPKGTYIWYKKLDDISIKRKLILYILSFIARKNIYKFIFYFYDLLCFFKIFFIKKIKKLHY